MKPRLVYDGECGFCRYTVEYARILTGDRVDYQPYQEVGEEYPHLSADDFRESIRYIDESGLKAGAQAAFETLAVGGRTTWIDLYRRLPGFAATCELAYRWVSRHREMSLAASRVLFGRQLVPLTYTRTAELTLRGIFLCGLFALVSLWWQAMGLFGSNGILPASEFLDAVYSNLGTRAMSLLPTVFWIASTDTVVHCVFAIGCLACLSGLLGRLRLTSAVMAYLAYLSLLNIGQVFTSYQWDILLVECFVVGAFLSRMPTAGIWLVRFLLFRFMFLSGIVKLLSGDPTWADLTALEFHFETQPLPNPLSWFAHGAPDWLLRAGVLATFVVELGFAFFVFAPRNVRAAAAIGFVALELLIFATGNYNFFNILTIVLCIALLDDQRLGRKSGRQPAAPDRIRSLPHRIGAGLAGLLMVQGSFHVVNTLGGLPGVLSPTVTATRPWRLTNPYGLFAVMTTQRHELIVQGSMDGVTWLDYELPFKPGDPDRIPGWATPHQPRLDWQLWFAALTSPASAPWVYDFATRLLDAEPAVLGLLDAPSFGPDGNDRPRYIRILTRRYRFAESGSSSWWEVGPPRVWLPAMRKRVGVVTHEPLVID